MIKIQTIKTLILEFIAGNGSSHLQEIHLSVTEFRPGIPQHTVRARLSEMSRSQNLEEKLSAFGNGFYGLYEENEALCSVVSYPDRGPWGDPSFRGNCSGYLAKDLMLRFGCESVFDPAEGSGTVRDVVHGINRYRDKGIHYEGRDLSQGWDVLTSPLPERQFDMVWYHPPYWDIVKYSGHGHDLSNCASFEEFEGRLNRSVEKLIGAVTPGGIMAILIGDKRKSGAYYPLFRSLLMNSRIGELKAIIIKIQHHCQSDKKQYGAGNPFLIPIKHEYCLIYQKLMTGPKRCGFANSSLPFDKSLGETQSAITNFSVIDRQDLSRGPLDAPKTTRHSIKSMDMNLMEVIKNECSSKAEGR